MTGSNRVQSAHCPGVKLFDLLVPVPQQLGQIGVRSLELLDLGVACIRHRPCVVQRPAAG
ncbi:hypothetical protein J5Y04_13450 [Kitasatospora sp. RG8]|uniref:hypothetical protein n=1 Tax=Kitasatospora sp. RG8 TaxID=2820815 RepID=UPI001AE02E1E|nr:hypothetical protein [Kitasatospora sp. RG8]MBP0450546.1 hypothetical protein [Kitasatospora sp. RG8]